MWLRRLNVSVKRFSTFNQVTEKRNFPRFGLSYQAIVNIIGANIVLVVTLDHYRRKNELDEIKKNLALAQEELAFIKKSLLSEEWLSAVESKIIQKKTTLRAEIESISLAVSSNHSKFGAKSSDVAGGLTIEGVGRVL